ncbi:MAG TPA: tRNA (pseudouridine(54)-N(1))-methyltransferase TrmY [Thermoplasmata archaeon]|nr:tRNA (pseudouridine(54)-N(1))-methyltransferase TrmY [Thermoplasmata archaeon]
MRRFLILAHRVPATGQFTLNDLAGGGGRMDEIARSVSTAFTVSNDLRRDTELTILFAAEPGTAARRIVLDGRRLRYLNPDERSTAALLKNALVRAAGLSADLEASPGLTVGPVDALAALRGFGTAPELVWLTEGGSPLRDWRPGTSTFAAVLSDPYDPTPEEQAVLTAAGATPISVGPRSIRTSQCIDIVHNEFDRREATAPRSGE